MQRLNSYLHTQVHKPPKPTTTTTTANPENAAKENTEKEEEEHRQPLPPYILNLDPAVRNLPYEANIDIRDTVDYKEVMKQ